jgi:hypothetical protein
MESQWISGGREFALAVSLRNGSKIDKVNSGGDAPVITRLALECARLAGSGFGLGVDVTHAQLAAKWSRSQIL